MLTGLLGLAAFAPAAAFAGSISGAVTDAVTLEPVEGLEVCAYPLSEEWETWFCEDTDASGEYTIEELDPDEYAVEFWGRPLNYVPQYFDGRERWWESDPVLVGSGAITEIDAAMVVGGRVEGNVEEAGSGNPLEEVIVCAWTISNEEFGGCTESDASGEYELKGMPAGAYEIEFWPLGQNYQPQWYDHQSQWWEADPVAVFLGAVETGIDADLLPGTGVEGQVRTGGAPVNEAEVCIWSTDPEGGGRCTYSGGDGRYALQGLPADEYQVEFFDYTSELIQFWDHRATWEDADVLSLTAGSILTGIDADLGDNHGPVVPPVVTPPVTTGPVLVKHQRKRCKKGFRKKRVHGKVRCVKKKRKHRHRHVHGRPPVRDRATFRHGR
ncbi:MAG: hypothetical protein QOF06_1393 [Solirubrobacterales bacterium]|nr:hypothetical protein [Solirubrobacterales bacterium]